MTAQEKASIICGRLTSKSGNLSPVYCLLGPPGCGKTEVAKAAHSLASQTGARTVYLDLREQESQNEDEFFGWVMSNLKRSKWAESSRYPRLDFVDQLIRASRDTAAGLLVIDHMECLPDEIARELVVQLREYQEEANHLESQSLLCLVAGSVSMLDLRRRANSPNLQFEHTALPDWDPAGAELHVQSYFHLRRRTVEREAIRRIAKWTGGEPAFVRLIEERLNGGEITAVAADRAARKALQHAADIPYLAHIARAYWMDSDLRQCADRLAGGRQPDRAHDAGLRDVDPFQLLGAFVAEAKTPPRYRFRNELVRELCQSLRDAALGVSPKHPIDQRLYGVPERLRGCEEAEALDEWRASLVSAWELVTGQAATVALKIEKATRAGDAELIIVPPNVIARIRYASGQMTVEAEAIRGDWCVRATVTPIYPVRPTVALRYLIETWLKLFGRSAAHGLLLHFAEIGRQRVLEEQVAETRRKNVFVVFGRSHVQRDAMYEFVKSLGLDPIDWHRAWELTGNPSATIFDIVDAGMRSAQACVIVLTGDDMACLRPELQAGRDPAHERDLTPQARQNVLFEAGMAFGRYRNRSIITQFGNVRPFSDMHGFWSVAYQNDMEFRKELRSALKMAGCPIDEKTAEWQAAGSFSNQAATAGQTV